MRRNHERAAQLQTYSAAGACFQMLLIYAEIEALWETKGGDNGDRFRHVDRARRLCHSVVEFFEEALGVDAYDLAKTHYMKGRTDPRYLTRRAVEDYLEPTEKK
jgi:hypothetical protein